MTTEREHVPSLDCWCRPVVEAYGNLRGGIMPLKRGKAAKTKAGIAANIRAERAAGRPQDQAVAIAMRTAGKPRKPKKKS